MLKNVERLSKLIIWLMVFGIFTNAAQAQAAKTKYKCMIQLTNYTGEGAYIVVSLMDAKGAYEKTLYMAGPDNEWYPELKEWHKFNTKKPANISAITGASIAGGDRGVVVIEIDNSKLNKGYSIRFETSVENNKYYVKDLEVPLTTEGLAAKSEGSGYIRYVRFIPN